MLKFTQYVDMSDIEDSMELDSNTTICTLETETHFVSIEVRGEVKVRYKDEWYHRPSEFPTELKERIHSDAYWSCDENVYVDMNNWFEAFWKNKPDQRVESFDLVDVENSSPKELLDLCLTLLEVKTHLEVSQCL